MRRVLPILAAGIFLLGGSAIRPVIADEESNASADKPYMQGLGEFMLAAQLHHNKLFYAGDAGNWDLASYELDELKEGLSNGAKFYPEVDGFKVADQKKSMVDGPLDQLDKAIGDKSKSGFVTAFTALTTGCDNCHAASKHAFIRIVKPTAPSITNQNYAPK